MSTRRAGRQETASGSLWSYSYTAMAQTNTGSSRTFRLASPWHRWRPPSARRGRRLVVAWYPLDGPDGRHGDAVTVAARSLIDWLDAAAGDAPEIALLGFSQGAAVSLQALRPNPSVSVRSSLSAVMPRRMSCPTMSHYASTHPRVFWGRGTNDDVIPTPLIEHTSQWLPDHSELTGRVYPGLTHSISEDELVDVRVFLEKWLEASAT